MAELDRFLERYHQLGRRKILFFLLLAAVAVIAIFLTLGFGVYKIGIFDAIATLFNHLAGNPVNPSDDHYVFDVRLPRAIGAIAVGAGLAVGGAVMQNVLRNPLAEPYTIGISSGAFLGAVLSLVFGFSIIPTLSGDMATVVNAFLFSLIPVSIILLVSRFKKLSSATMILLGIAVMFVFSSISQTIMVTCSSESLSDVYNWRVGTLAKVTWGNLPFIIVFTVAISALLMSFSKKMDLINTGDKIAQILGVNVERLRLALMVFVSLMTAALVSFTGTIGFIGLVGPHVARMFVGSSNRYLIPAAAAFGGTFLILADTVAKVSGINGLPVGVISAMIGGPLFIYILIKRNKKVWA